MNEDRLKQLLDHYYDGTSSEQEESMLRLYFNGTDIIPGYDAEKEIFCHYSGAEIYPGPSEDLEERILKSIIYVDSNRNKRSAIRPLYELISIAATILLLVGSYYLLLHKAEPRDTYSDPQIAYVETMKILHNISVKLNKSTMELQLLARLNSATRSSLESIDRSASMITAGLKEIQVFDKLSESGDQTNTTINHK